MSGGVPRRRAALAVLGAALFLVTLLFGALVADPMSLVQGANDLLLARAGATVQLVRAPDGALLRTVLLGKLSAEVPVVLVHGLGASSDYWIPTALSLFRKGRTVIVLDMPGSGRSGAPTNADGYGLPSRVASLSSVVSALDLRKVDLVGHSLGGWTAGLYAIAEPHHVRRLVLVDAGGFTNPSPAELDALLVTLTPRTRDHGRGLFSLLFHRAPFPRAGFVVSTLGRMYRVPSVVETVSRFEERDGLLGKEHLLPPGTVLIWGERDTLLPLADARRSAPRIPGGRLLVVTGVGHDGPLEAPRLFQRALDSALSGNARTLRAEE